MSQDEAEGVVPASASDWSIQSNASISLYYMGRTSDASLTYNGANIVFFRPEANGSMTAQTYMWSRDGVMLEADMVVYDGGWAFLPDSSPCSGSQRYLHDTTIHEFGHVLGLGHSAVAGATMWPSVSACSTSLRSLAADDIAAIESLYPPAGSGATTAPPAPSGLWGSSTSSTSVSLSWTDSAANEDGFYVERSTNGSTFVMVRQLPTNTASYTDPNLSSGTAYWYRLRAFNGAGASGYSNTASAATLAAAAPAASSFTASGTARKDKGVRSVDLRWSGAASSLVDVYRNGTRTVATANDGSYTDPVGGKGGGTFKYRLCAAGTATCSNEVTVVF